MEESSYIQFLENVDPDINHFEDYDVNFTPYDLETLKDNISIENGFNLLHHNARSLLTEGKLDEYGVLMDSLGNPFHILGFSETWLHPENVNVANFEGYEHVYNVRPPLPDNDRRTGEELSLVLRNVNI